MPVNPTAYEGRANTIKDPDLRALAWLGNLNYWCQLSLLDASYRRKSKPEFALAASHHDGAAHVTSRSICRPRVPRFRSTRSAWGSNPHSTTAAGKRFTHRMLEETRNFARSIERPAACRLQSEYL